MFSKKDHCDKVLLLWAPIRDKLYWIILNIVNDRGLAEDVLQESLIIAIEKFQTLQDESKFEPWFVTISIRKSYELLAAKKIFNNVQTIEDDYLEDENDTGYCNAVSTLQYKELIACIMQNIKQDTKKYLFYLRYIEDKSTEEIMKITGLKEGTVKSIYSRMRKEIGAILRKEYGIDEK
jgi:RNA polymerase sigma-70 factor, ECF subfamily